MAPEQTGRMNRVIDYRTDFYSLGVTLYEMLTGTLPFTTQDPLELVHGHIAKQPVSPHTSKQISPAVSDIVMKLLAKNAEERYQSAAGLKFDLENCLLQLQTTGEINNFIVGQRDQGSQLLISQKLYGREKEVATLMDAFWRISQGTTEMLLVSGYSGIGKTSIVHEVHKPIVAARGYFITGKFDQFKKDIPYAALIQAFQELIRQLLTEDEQQIAIWKDKLLTALGINGQVLIDVIPEVELIISSQPEVPQLGTAESENRFNRVFKQFVNVFCQPEHPLVIFLDDLQWADSASLKLIKFLITDDDSKYLFLIGAYRDNEVNPTHPLIQNLQKIRQTNTVVNNITIKPLLLSHVQEIIADTFNINQDSKKIELLAELLFNKTQGNPFFLTQLLKTLYTENLLVYQVDTDSWHWEIQEIQAFGITDYNIVDLIARNIRKLPPETQQILQLAACIGNQFNLEVLATINENSEITTATYLWSALQAGLILPLSSNYKIPLAFTDTESEIFNVTDIKIGYKFLHDRVQQAAYSLIPETERKITHFHIGQILLRNTATEVKKDNIFVLVNQLNYGIDLLKTPVEKEELAKLNLVAGQKAKASTAYEAAVKYLNIALQLIQPINWQNQEPWILKLYLETAESEYLNANLEQALSLSNLAIAEINDFLEKLKFYQIQLKIYLAKNEIYTVLELGQQILKMLGVSLVESPPENLDINQLTSLSAMTDPYKLAAMEILILIYAPACFAESPTALPMLYTMIELSRKYGNSPPSIYAYAVYGTIMAWLIPDIDFAYQMGQLSLNVLEKLNAKQFKSKAFLTININILYKKQHIKTTINNLHEAIESALEVGDIEFACHSANFYCSHIFFVGQHLESVAKEQSDYIDFISKLEQQHPLFLTKICAQAVENLINPAVAESRLIGNILNEEEAISYLQEINNLISLFDAYFYKLFLCYLFEEYKNAIKFARIAENYAGFVQSEIIFTQHNWFYSLALLADYQYHILTSEQDQKIELEQYSQQVDKNQKSLQYWAEHAPINYQHKYDLVAAEKAKILGQTLIAMELYDLAIAGAKKSEYIQDEALAYELAAKFYLGLGREEIAQTYMTKAHYAYISWGAIAKVKDLESKYPQLILVSQKEGGADKSNISLSATTSSSSQILDTTSIIKASQTLASEIILDNLLEKLMNIVIENAGAQIGFLILKQQGQLCIAAKVTLDSSDVVVCNLILDDSSQQIPSSLINYVVRTREDVILGDAAKEGRFSQDVCIMKKRPKSVLCTPIIYQGELFGLLYLENNLAIGAFTPERLKVLKLLSSQAAISIKNAQLYENLKQEIRERQQAEEALRESEKQLTQFLDAVPIGIFVINEQGRPFYANQTAQKILGQGIVDSSKTMQLAKMYQAYIQGTENHYPTEKQPIIRALNGESIITDDMELHLGNKIIPLEVLATPIFDNKGKIIYAIAAFQDITERKKAEVEREKFTHQLFQFNQAFSRFVPRQFLQLLNKESILDVTLGDNVQQEMSILFSDIRDFTRLSETMTPENNFKFINSYLSRMEPAIIENQGFIDKYIGDAIMALFSRCADDALKAGITMLLKVVEYNQIRQNIGYQPIQIGIGINTGSLMLGTVGGENRMDGTVISDAVNLASRIEGLTKNYGVSLLISHHTFSQLENSNQYHIRLIDRVQVKGKLELVSVFEVFDADLPEIREGKLFTRLFFEEALLLYNQGDFRNAGLRFADCLRHNPGDHVSRLYLERCQKLIIDN